ncbi:heavy-metal-associated domain-containing protein [Pedobacter duraquae]|uniref:HMA domain-containing protein n=1 Tax=Pedobacter duraquae TaxID=425511 RepID=A0A4R6IJ80_9SPHI|nr:heavy metal-associated domain-containing protein [Pedobacter duraquae]TDO21985.1 hypothetical protein CLV32_3094 [Pedobacter duraquae]
MKILKFKTNIMCGSCVANVTPILNQMDVIESWTVDTLSPSKTLIVKAYDSIYSDDLITALKSVGYAADPIG